MMPLKWLNHKKKVYPNSFHSNKVLLLSIAPRLKLPCPKDGIVIKQQLYYKLSIKTTIGLQANHTISLQLAIKRIFDLCASTILLVVLLPLFILIAIAIKLDSPGPVFFKQVRVGHFQRRFPCYKFRSMKIGSHDTEHEKFIEQLMTKDAVDDKANSYIYKITNDNRITKVGRILRKLSLDELPQLLNILKGEMSLVGPRPAIGYELKYHDENMLRRFFAKPGITGYWQVNSRYSVDYREMVAMDLFYVDHWSLLLDLRIVLNTVPVLLKITRSF